jgi:exosortase J
MLMAPTSLILSMRAWRGHRWQAGGWWGLALVGVCAVVAEVVQFGTFGYRSAVGAIYFLPIGLLLWGYASGVVILFGGADAWRKVAFPLALLLFVNPVPSFFTNVVDLPLQHVGARAAWIFAHWVGIPVNGKGGDLWLYFAPGYGMFIAPACNGLRSAVTMGYLALVAGYLYGLSRPWHAAYVVGAVLLAFVLNSLRLCLLVLLNRLALAVPFLYQALEHEASWIDYMLYIPIFLVASIFLLGLPRLLSSRFKNRL